MGSRNAFILTPILDPDGIAESQSPVGAGDLTLDGVLVSGGVLTLSNAHRITITSTDTDTGNTFTITGKDERDIPTTEAITGPDDTTVVGIKYFKEITSIAISGASTGAITIGVNGESVTQWFSLNNGKIINTGFGVILSTGATLTYSIEHTFSDIQQNSDITVDTFEHADTRDKTANDDGNYAFPVEATRLRVKAFTSGIATVTYMQAF